MATDPHKRYSVVGPGDELEPNFERVVQALSDEDLEEEIFSRRGEPGYMLALVAEAERRGHSAPPEPAARAGRAYDADEWPDDPEKGENDGNH